MVRIKSFLKINFSLIEFFKNQSSIIFKVTKYCVLGVRMNESSEYELFIFKFTYKNLMLKNAIIFSSDQEDVIIEKIKILVKQPHLFKNEIYKHQKSFFLLKSSPKS